MGREKKVMGLVKGEGRENQRGGSSGHSHKDVGTSHGVGPKQIGKERSEVEKRGEGVVNCPVETHQQFEFSHGVWSGTSGDLRRNIRRPACWSMLTRENRTFADPGVIEKREGGKGTK